MKFDMNVLLIKLSSRKFWALLAGLIGSILMTFSFDEGSIQQITGIISGVGVLVAYIIGESIVDHGRAKNPADVIIVQKENPNE